MRARPGRRRRPCADGGLAVAMVERELVGGECSYWGCIPSKTLIRPGDVLAAARRVPGAAEAVTGRLDTRRRVRPPGRITRDWWDDGQLPWLESKGIDTGPRHGPAGRRAGRRGRGRRRRRPAADRGAGGGAGHRDRSAAFRPSPACGRPAPGTTGRDRRQGGAGAAAGARRRGGRRRDGAGVQRLGSEEVAVVEGAERLLAREEPFAGEEVRAASRPRASR